MRFQTLPLLLILSLLASCVGTEIGNPQTDTDVQVEFDGFAEGSEEPVVVMRQSFTLDSGITFTEVWLSFPEIELRIAPDCDSGDDHRVERATVVELVTRREFPSRPATKHPSGTFCRLEMDLDVSETLPADVPEELNQYSVLIRGTNADGVDFELRDVFSERFRLDGPFELASGPQSLLVGFALNDWLESEDVAGGPGEDLVIVDDTTRPEVIEAFRRRVAESARLFRDEGADGIVD